MNVPPASWAGIAAEPLTLSITLSTPVVRRSRNAFGQAAACRPGNLVENLATSPAGSEQQRLNRYALRLCLDRRGMRPFSVRLTVREKHDHT
jgi:hypothetical protein